MPPLPLSLQPLDRVQILSRRVLSEMHLGPSHRGHRADAPFWFFQRQCADGRLEVCTASGYLDRVDLFDVCDLVRADEPVIVMAMTPSALMARQRLPVAVRQAAPPDPDCFSPAMVARVERDRWGGLTPLVNFLDARHNPPDSLWRAPLMDGELARLKPLATRRRMPVVSVRSSGTAGFEVAAKLKERDAAHRQVRALVSAALAGDAAQVRRVAEVDAAAPAARSPARRAALAL